MATLGVAGLTGTPANASSHREAPLISQDPTADNTDVYLFRDPVDQSKVNIVANYIPLQQPASGPNFHRFGDDVLYELHIDNDGDVKDDVTYQFRFRTEIVNKGTFLYNTGVIGNGPGYENLNIRQTYSVRRIDKTGSRVLATDLVTPPVNVGDRSTRADDQGDDVRYENELAQPAVNPLGANGVDGRVFAGQRDDPFFADLGSAFDLLGLRPLNPAHLIPLPEEPGRDGVAGKNGHTIALQLPITAVSKNGTVPTEVNNKDSVIGVYASSSRQRVRVLTPAGGTPRVAGRWVQVSRLALPLVNEV
ncbi:MAG: DUF4331 domain-containing protein, partial [Actinomycetota bacterium]|nr:DUF4331 domain-containing protein [Actinomycetota bacterium]